MDGKQRLTVLLLSAALLGSTASAAETTRPAPVSAVWEPAPAKQLRVGICASATRGLLYTYDGTALQELTFDRNAQTVAGPLSPGDYIVQAGSLRAAFTLRENGAVTLVSGDGWSDGERLHLSSDTVGALPNCYEGPWRWQLEGESVCTPELTDSTCRYRTLPFGCYILRGGSRDIPLLLTPQNSDQTLDLRPPHGEPLDPP